MSFNRWWKNCGIFTQWNTTQQYKRMKQSSSLSHTHAHTQNNLDESQRHYAEWNKPGAKGNLLYVFISKTFHTDKPIVISEFQRPVGLGWRKWPRQVEREFLWGWWNYYFFLIHKEASISKCWGWRTRFSFKMSVKYLKKNCFNKQLYKQPMACRGIVMPKYPVHQMNYE